MVFLFISIMTFTAVTGLLISLNWWLGLITGAMFAPVLVFCTVSSGATRSSPGARRTRTAT